MNVTISAWQQQSCCTWCEKDRECVAVSFDDGFLKDSALCWGCLQKAVKVRARRSAGAQTEQKHAPKPGA